MKSSPLSIGIALLKIHVFNKPSTPLPSPPPPTPSSIRHLSSVKHSSLPTLSHLQQIQNSNKIWKRCRLYTVQITIFNSHFWVLRFAAYVLNTLWIRNRVNAKSGYSFTRWRNKIEPSSLPWILQSKWQPRSKEGSLTAEQEEISRALRHMLCCQYS